MSDAFLDIATRKASRISKLADLNVQYLPSFYLYIFGYAVGKSRTEGDSSDRLIVNHILNAIFTEFQTAQGLGGKVNSNDNLNLANI